MNIYQHYLKYSYTGKVFYKIILNMENRITEFLKELLFNIFYFELSDILILTVYL